MDQQFLRVTTDLTLRRRALIAMLGAAAAARAWPSLAQQPNRMRTIGVLMNSAADDKASQSYLPSFVQQLQNRGWNEGQNLRVEIRRTVGDPERMKAYATELVAQAPDVLFAVSTPNLTALQHATQSIPIVFVEVSDPIAQGFVPNLTHPGGNITGFSAYDSTIGAKWLDLLKQIAPGLMRVSILFNPDTSPQSRFFGISIKTAAPGMGVEVAEAPVHSESEIIAIIETIAHQPNSGLIVPSDTFTAIHRDVIIARAARYRVPTMYALTYFVREGGLMGYAYDQPEAFRQAASYVDRILKGDKPGDLPVQQPTKYQFVLNLKTAKALGLTVPPSLLVRADEVIE